MGDRAAKKAKLFDHYEDEYVKDSDSEEFDMEEYWGETRVRERKERVEAMRREEEELDKLLLFYCDPYDPLDVSNAIPILVDQHQFGPNFLDGYFAQCHDRRIFNLYDHPGDPRCGGFLHLEGKDVNKAEIELAAYVVDTYNKLIDDHNRGDVKLKLIGVDKVTSTADIDAYHYLTFTASDVVDHKEKTYQAQLLQTVDDDLLLGMLRDVGDDKTLAVIQFRQEPHKDSSADSRSSSGGSDCGGKDATT